MLGGSFNDILNGGAGNDIMDGGLGYDWADYQDATGGVKVDLALTAAGSTATGTDRILDFTADVKQQCRFMLLSRRAFYPRKRFALFGMP